MNKAIVAIGLGLALSVAAFAQEKSAKEQLVGAWTLVAVTSEMDDGQIGEPFGPSPKGVMISQLMAISRFSNRARKFQRLRLMTEPRRRPRRRKVSWRQAFAYYGTYSVDENTKGMMVNLAASTSANVAAIPNQKRTITLLNSDELKFDNP
ncbi:lipocalin-like domain-containing protein [Bradyrhizobium sp. 145]|uniref:lipocalin-like domain-containing protein n=1 Tax=Bradyrhizobium sp. 145 TaxID=2782621 RepID=UPI001FFAAEC7|nr:lipocalin-like domain-containing protein [Bradyrhizobium sp. 145]MCK1687362.1 lipocalin-like domain-containing protein [Bradyrhizobium sp. 145]